MITVTQLEGTKEPLPIRIYDWIIVYIAPFSFDTSVMTKLLKKANKSPIAAEKTKYFMHQIDAVNLTFTNHLKWSLEATRNFPYSIGIFPMFKEGSKYAGAAMVFTLIEKNSQTVMSRSSS